MGPVGRAGREASSGDDLGLVDDEAAVVGGERTGRDTVGAVDVGDGAGGSADQVVAVVADPRPGSTYLCAWTASGTAERGRVIREPATRSSRSRPAASSTAPSWKSLWTESRSEGVPESAPRGRRCCGARSAAGFCARLGCTPRRLARQLLGRNRRALVTAAELQLVQERSRVGPRASSRETGHRCVPTYRSSESTRAPRAARSASGPPSCERGCLCSAPSTSAGPPAPTRPTSVPGSCSTRPRPAAARELDDDS